MIIFQPKHKIYSYQQLEHSDCGQTCIRIICRYYGIKLSRKYLDSIIEGGRQGMSIAEIRATLEKLGFKTAAVKVPISRVADAPLPCIVYWNQNHFIVLHKVDIINKKYHIVNPAEGRRILNIQDFQKGFSQTADRGILLLIDPTDKLKNIDTTGNQSDNNMRLMIRKLISSDFKSISCVILLMLICIAMDISVPFLFQHTVDDGILNKNLNLIWILIMSQLLLFIGSYIISNIAEIILTKLGLKLGIEMLNDYLNKLVRMPMHFFARKVNSDFIQKVEDHNRIRSFLVNFPQTIFFTILSLFIFGGILVYYSPIIFIIFLVFTSLSLVWTCFFLRYRREIDYSLSANTADNRNNLFELVQGVEEIKSNNAHNVRVKSWHDTQKKINEMSLKSALMNLYQNGGHILLTRMRDLAVTGICASLVVQDYMSLGIMMTVSYVAGRFASPFNSIISSINQIQDANMSFNRIDEIDSTTNEPCYGTIINRILTLSLENVSFKYPGYASPEVISNITLTIPIGKVIALVGESGSGKSTLLKLILGFYRLSNGNIKINKQDLHTIDEESILSKIAIVMQNGTLFSTSILNNIAIADEVPNLQRAKNAAKMAAIDEFIESLPMGYHTRIGQTGLELSGGQRQRIFIARAIYRNPDILMLDEATSSLDAITESKIMKNIYSHFKNRTVIVAAHRLSTIKYADKIIVLDKGKIAESGSHEHLIGLKGKYSRLIDRQIVLQ